MRYASLLLVASVLLSSGCSYLIAASGEDLSKLATREQVQEQFGQPSSSDRTEEGPCEEYRTRRKIAEPVQAERIGLTIAMTFGVGELAMFPYELYLLGRRTIVGQDVRFCYDDAGNVTRVFLDGEPLGFPPWMARQRAEQETASPHQIREKLSAGP